MQLARKQNSVGGARAGETTRALGTLAAWTMPSVPWGGAEEAAEAAASAAADYESAEAGYGDPDWFPGDPERARSSFCANLLSEIEAKSVAAKPPLEFAEVRKLLKTESSASQIDPEVIATVDIRTQYRVYIADGEVYSRAGLLAAFPFGALGKSPEEVFDRQVLGSFPTGPPANERERTPENFDLVAQDAPFRCAVPSNPRPDPGIGWPGDAAVLAGMKAKWRHRVHFVAGKDGPTSELRHPDKVSLTKVFVGKKAWQDFRQLCGVVGQLATTPVGQSLFLGAGASSSAPLALGPTAVEVPDAPTFVEAEPPPPSVSFVELESETESETESEPAPRVTFVEPVESTDQADSFAASSAATDLRAAADGLAEIAAGLSAMFSALRHQNTR